MNDGVHTEGGREGEAGEEAVPAKPAEDHELGAGESPTAEDVS